MAYGRFTDSGSPNRGTLLSALTHRINPRFMLTTFFVFALFVTAWTIYITGTMHDVLQLVKAPFYGSGEGSRPGGHPSGLGDPLGDVTAPPPPENQPGSWITPGDKDSQPGGAAAPGSTTHKVIGLVFFGRKELVQVLDCYLKRNLKENGGILDEVIFAVNTENESDLKYLDELIPTSKSYRKHVSTGNYDWWIGSWEPVDDPDAIYIKIDDDVVYFEDETIPAIVKRLRENPKYFAVSANVINNPALAWVHYMMGLYEPFWPEIEKPAGKISTSWKPSDLPSYEGDPEGPQGFKDGSEPAPYEGHRWLPVRTKPGEKPYDISLTPASTLTYDAFGPSLQNWAAGAQTHYSFLSHLERNEVSRYHFDLWDYAYERLSINFFAVRGADVIEVFPFPQKDDEDYLTRVRPRQVGRHVIVDGTGVAVHFAFGPQYKAHDNRGLAWTDALGRYRGYAQENICSKKQHVKTVKPTERSVRSAKWGR